MPAARRLPARRTALTLAELLIVVGVLAALAAISWPMLRGPIQRHQLLAAAKQLRTAWGKARLDAMDSGIARLFRFQPGGSRYEIAACRTTEAEQAPTRLWFSPPAWADRDPAGDSLPKAVAFYLPGDSQRAGGDSELALPEGRGRWGPPILFFPDGKTSGARIRLVGRRGLYVDVVLRGLTGSVQIGQVRQMEANP
ncbi:MAG: pilus assembly FimT family protein [Thermoguttaceae bacterium]